MLVALKCIQGAVSEVYEDGDSRKAKNTTACRKEEALAVAGDVCGVLARLLTMLE